MKMLYITKGDVFAPPKSGGAQCAVRNYRLVEKTIGKENCYACMLVDKKVEKKSNHVKYFYYKNTIIDTYWNYLFLRNGFGRKTENEIVKFVNNLEPDIIFFDGSLCGGWINRIRNRCRIVTFYHNIEHDYAWERVKHSSFLCIFRFIANWYNERKLTLKSDRCICLNGRDAKALEKLYHRECDFYLPITFEDYYENSAQINAQEEPYILFVGSNFLPNVQGITWFVENVMPELSIKLKIVGKDMENVRNELERSNVEVIGTVDDLKSYYVNARAMVMPIFMGSGMKVKTAEAMMYGKAIFGTKEAFEGYEVEGLKNIYECSTKEMFIQNIKEYLDSDKVCFCDLSIRKVFLEKYETKAVEVAFQRMIEELMS